MKIVIGKLVDVPPPSTIALTPVPMNVTAEAPARSMPSIIAPTFAPGPAEFGLMPVIVDGGATVKPLNGGDVPADAVTVTDLVPKDAAGSIEMDTGRLVDEPLPRMLAVTPVPLNVTRDAPLRATPVIVPLTEVPRPTMVGLIAVTVVVFVIVNPLNEGDVAPLEFTVNVRRPSAAPGSIVIVTGTL
jgi:hypothetical protein